MGDGSESAYRDFSGKNLCFLQLAVHLCLSLFSLFSRDFCFSRSLFPTADLCPFGFRGLFIYVFIYYCLNVCLFIFEKDCEQGRDRERESQAGFVLPAQHLMRGLNS